jgi:hypothetical protein
LQDELIKLDAEAGQREILCASLKESLAAAQAVCAEVREGLAENERALAETEAAVGKNAAGRPSSGARPRRLSAEKPSLKKGSPPGRFDNKAGGEGTSLKRKARNWSAGLGN